MSPDLITGTDIIFITIHMNTGCYFRRLLIQCEQNVTCFMVESFETKERIKIICFFSLFLLFFFNFVCIFFAFFSLLLLALISLLLVSANYDAWLKYIVYWTWYWIVSWRFTLHCDVTYRWFCLWMPRRD